MSRITSRASTKLCQSPFCLPADKFNHCKEEFHSSTSLGLESAGIHLDLSFDCFDSRSRDPARSRQSPIANLDIRYYATDRPIANVGARLEFIDCLHFCFRVPKTSSSTVIRQGLSRLLGNIFKGCSSLIYP